MVNLAQVLFGDRGYNEWGSLLLAEEWVLVPEFVIARSMEAQCYHPKREYDAHEIFFFHDSRSTWFIENRLLVLFPRI